MKDHDDKRIKDRSRSRESARNSNSKSKTMGESPRNGHPTNGHPTNGHHKNGYPTNGHDSPSHAHRPYLDSRVQTSRRTGVSMYHSDPIHYSRAGIGVVFRDAESTARALQEIAQKKQELAERKRAGILLGMLVLMATSVHILTRPRIAPPQLALTSRGNDATIDYGGGNQAGDETIDTGNTVGVTTNATRRESILDHFADSITDYTSIFTPYFFHVPRSGGQTIKDVVSLCLNKVQASEVGIRNGHHQDSQLQIVTIDEARYVNVDTTSKQGIERAAMMGFEASQMAEMVTSSYFLNAARYLFSEEHPGRAFVLLRNPIHRAVSMYHYRRSNGELDEKITLEEFARGNGIENNWITRFLTNAMEGELKKSHLDQAKKILSKKFLIGFLDDAEESVIRMMKFMGWKYDEDETKALMQQDCVQKKLQEGSNRNPDEYEMPKKGSQAHALIAWQTQYDLKLYEFAKQLFDVQTKQYGSKERKKELRKKNKAKDNKQH